MNQDRLELLLDRYFDEAITPEEQKELEATLLSWPQARTLFWKRARFHSLLRRRGRENWGRRLAMEKVAGPETSKWLEWRALWSEWKDSLRPVGWWAAAGLAAVIVFLMVNPGQRAGSRDGSSAPPSLATTAPSVQTQGIATMLRAVGVEWTGQQERPGNVLGPGWLKFEKGLVEVQFHRGARVVIEGPAEFELITDMQGRCLAGKVQADVPPPAIGFEILAPQVRVVDRGTAFGMEVKRDGAAEIHVFSGKVDYSTTKLPDDTRELLQGEAVRVEQNGAWSDIPNGPDDFMDGEGIAERANTAMAARFAAWEQQSERLRTDPALLVQYTFEGNALSRRSVRNHAAQAPKETQGTVIGCSWTEGRWPGKQALDFKQVGDRIRFALPREHRELTCVMWVRLDAIDRPYSALLMSGDAAVGELQWQFGSDGRLRFGKRQHRGWGWGKLLHADSPPVLGPQQCGSWMQLGFVYDAGAGTLAHYVNGQSVGQGQLNAEKPLTTGALEIGNWTPAGGDPMEPIRAFNGRMDEFLVFSRALRADEIQRLWEVGRPL